MANLREQLEEVRDATGTLTPRGVVEAARPEDAPLHGRFNWDDQEAAELYRIDQARELIRSVKVQYVDSKGAPATVRGFVSVMRPDSMTREYRPVEDVAEDPFSRKLLLQEADREWRAFKQKYSHLSEFMEQVAKEAGAA